MSLTDFTVKTTKKPRVSTTVYPDRKYDFNEIANNIRKEIMKKYK